MIENKFSKGLIDGLSIALGYFPVAFAFGIFAVSNGLTSLQALFISMTNVTSAGQLAAVPIIAAGGTLAELAVSQFIINLRYSLMSITLSQKFDGSIRLIDRFIIAFVNTDEVFGIASGKKGNVGRNYMYGLIIPPFVSWSAGTIIGAVAGDVLPEIITSALGIAIYGMFVGIIMPVVKEDRNCCACVLFAIVFSCIFKYLPFFSGIPSGFVVIICSVISSLIMAFVAPIEPDKGATPNE